MANKLINELPVLTGNTLEVTGLIPVQGTTSTNSVSVDDLMQSARLANKDLYNKCNVLLRRLELLEPTADNLIINQIYGGALKADTGSVSHSFIELYNPTEATISLVGKSIQYINLVATTTVNKLNLTGSIPAKHSFFIRCKLTNDGVTLGVVPALNLTTKVADMEWDMWINNKSITIALMDTIISLAVGVNPSTSDKYIDMIGTMDDKFEKAKYYEMSPAADQSKQKSIRRILFSDTDNNLLDCESVDYRIKENLAKAPRGIADGAWVLSSLMLQ